MHTAELTQNMGHKTQKFLMTKTTATTALFLQLLI